jgi:hypothetical protein
MHLIWLLWSPKTTTGWNHLYGYLGHWYDDFPGPQHKPNKGPQQ